MRVKGLQAATVTGAIGLSKFPGLPEDTGRDLGEEVEVGQQPDHRLYLGADLCKFSSRPCPDYRSACLSLHWGDQDQRGTSDCSSMLLTCAPPNTKGKAT